MLIGVLAVKISYCRTKVHVHSYSICQRFLYKVIDGYQVDRFPGVWMFCFTGMCVIIFSIIGKPI